MAVIVGAEGNDFNQSIKLLFQAARPINTHTHARTHAHIHTHTHTHPHARTHARTHTHTHKKKKGMRLKSFITTIY